MPLIASDHGFNKTRHILLHSKESGVSWSLSIGSVTQGQHLWDDLGLSSGHRIAALALDIPSPFQAGRSRAVEPIDFSLHLLSHNCPMVSPGATEAEKTSI